MITLCYCKRCGNKYIDDEYKLSSCYFCGTKMHVIPDEYLDAGRFLKREYEETFVETHIKGNPEFDPELHQKFLEHQEEGNRYWDMISQRISYGSSGGVSCPYCSSKRVKKIGTVGRLVSTGLFGLASGKIGKQWHCNAAAVIFNRNGKECASSDTFP